MDRPLTIKDAPMFQRVMKDPKLCKGVIESILGIEVGKIEYQNTEQALESYLGTRGVRLDVYLKSTGQVFDIEMQASSEPNLGMRMRYYQALIDSTLIDKGGRFKPFDKSYVIFICAYDHYEMGFPVYHIHRRVDEAPSVDVEDGSPWIVLNSTAWSKDKDTSRANLLKYVQEGTASDALTQGLASAVKAANDDAEWRKKAMGFMTLEMSTQMREYYAREDGIAEGEERYSKLVDALLSENRIDDLKRASDDAEYRQSLFKEYDL